MKSRLLAATLIVASLGLGACTVTPARVAVYPGYHEPPPRVIVAPAPRVVIVPHAHYSRPHNVILPGFDHHHEGRRDLDPRHRRHRHWHD